MRYVIAKCQETLSKVNGVNLQRKIRGS